MPRYRFTSTWPEVFSDLEVGVNATVVRNPGEEVAPDGATVVLTPGDELVTDQPYEHAHLVEIPDAPAEAPAAPPAPAPAEETAP